MQTIQVDQIKRIHIAGAGIMGASMGQLFARYGYQVVLYDAFQQGLDSGRNLIETNQETLVASGEATADESAAIKARIRLTMDTACFTDAQFVIEAIVENMDIKHKFWNQVSALAPADALLTTNTSGLSITKIAEAVKNPERFAGFHWVNPPHIVPLVEVIAGDRTACETMDKVRDVAKTIGKQPVMIRKDAPGFIINRIQFCLLREAMHIVESGIAEKEDVDNVLKYGVGMRYACLGPFQIADLGGLDTFYKIAGYLFPDLCDAKAPQAMLSELYHQQAYGVKSGRGFYDYSGEKADAVIKKRDADFIKLAKCLYEN